MKKNILFVESPLQLINAYEAVSFFGLNNFYYVIRLSGNVNNDKQLKEIVNRLELVDFVFLNLNAQNKKFEDYLVLLLYRFKYVFSSKDIEKIYIGNYDSKFLSLIMKQFSNDKIVLLDDGSKTFEIQRTFEPSQHLNLFTMYDILPVGKQIVYKNSYNRILALLRDENVVFDNSSVLFIGSKLSEDGAISEKYYITLLNEISEFYDGKTIIYVPHRDEDKNKLKEIGTINNVEVKTIGYPIEFFGLYESAIPATISSFFSTALMTMKAFYAVEIESFSFDFSNSDCKVEIANLYEYYKKEMNVVRLSDDI